MPRIYDSSALTQRRRDLVQAGSFINRIQSPTTPQTSYGPLQGNYDASVMNSIKNGQPKDFYRNNGCIIISNGCPCPPITTVDVLPGPSPPVILVPGPVRNIQLMYGSVIVTWEVPDPNTGGTPDSYTIIATSTGNPTVTVPGITSLTYSFATGDLLEGEEYNISVIGVNSAGDGATYAGTVPTIYAPYIAPVISLVSSPSTPNTININFNYTDFAVNSGTTTYTLNKYVNGVLDPTQITGTLSSTTQIQITSGISIQNTYSFTLQLQNLLQNEFSSISNLPVSVNVYPAGPTIISVTNITNNSARVNFVDYSSTFSLSGATCIVSGTGSSGVTGTFINNESLTLNNLDPVATYNGLQIAFRKTINGSIITSSTSSVPSFDTFGPAPVYTTYTANFTEVIIYYNSYPFITPTQATLTYTIQSTSNTQTVSAATITATYSVFVLPDPSNPPDPLPQGESLVDISIVVGTNTYSSLPGTVPNFLFVAAPQFITSPPFTASTNDVLISYNNYSNPVGLGNLSGARLITTTQNKGPFQTTVLTDTNATFDTGNGLEVGVEYTGCTLELFDSLNYNPTRYSAPTAPPFTFSLLYPAPTNVGTQDLTFKSIRINFMSSYEPNSGIFLYNSNGSAGEITVNSISYNMSSEEGYMIIEGLAQNTSYDDCRIRFTIGTFTSAETTFTSFTTTTPPQLSITGQQVSGSDLQVTYGLYTAFTPTSSVLTGSDNMAFSVTFNGSASEDQAVFNSVPTGDYTNCTITVTDGTYTAEQASPSFGFIIS